MSELFVPILVVVVLLLGLFSGVPITFALSGISIILSLILLGPNALFMMVNAALAQLSSDVLIAIPLFVLMAFTLEFSGISNALYKAMYEWAVGIKGGLAIGTLVICAIIAAMSGVAATGTVVMGVLALPEMRQRGYEKRFAVGPIVIGGALGVLIPPSVLMVIVGNLSTVSVGMLLIGGIVPGLMVVFLSCVYIFIHANLNPKIAPPIPLEERSPALERFKALSSLIPPIFLIIAVMGSIYSGIATPTESASLGAIGAILCAVLKRTFKWKKLRESLTRTLLVTSMIMWLVVGGACYSQLLIATGVSQFIFNMLSEWQVSPNIILLVMVFILYIAGMLIDPIAICLIFIPIFLPISLQIGLDPVYFMLIFAYTVIIGFITPPFGVNLFYMKGITANTDITMRDIFMSVIPYIITMTIVLILCLLFPFLLTWLPYKMVK